MSHAADLPAWAAWLTAFFLVTGAGLTLIGSVGLLSLKDFYQRVHAPTLGTSLGTGGILIGSMICFSVLGTRPVLHEILIAVFVTVTTPVTLILLTRAARHRDSDPESNRATSESNRATSESQRATTPAGARREPDGSGENPG